MIINSNLEKDFSGKISLLDGIQSKKDKIELFIRTLNGSIPFSDYGNILSMHIFNVLDEDFEKDLIDDLIKILSEKFELEISKYYYELNKDDRKIKLYIIMNDTTLLEIVA